MRDQIEVDKKDVDGHDRIDIASSTKINLSDRSYRLSHFSKGEIRVSIHVQSIINMILIIGIFVSFSTEDSFDSC